MDLLQHGRGKNRNIFLVGRSNCGKSFLLRPLEKLFRCLQNPAMNSFSFSGARNKEIILLDDFRFNQAERKPITWSQMLLLLDGATVNFSQPRTFCNEDFCLEASNSIPVFCTGKSVPVYERNGVIDGVESEMMRNRFRVFVFHFSIPVGSHKEAIPCPRCFADLLHASCPIV